MTQFATFDRAEEKCNQMDAHLLTIENQKESDFISDWLLATTSKLQCISDNSDLRGNSKKFEISISSTYPANF